MSGLLARRGLLLGESSYTPSIAQGIYDSLLSWWDFEDNLKDGVRLNDLSGTATYAAGKIGKKLVKGSMVSGAMTSPNLAGGVDGVSFGGWVYINGTGDEDIALRTGTGSTDNSIYFAIRSSGTQLNLVGVNSAVTPLTLTANSVLTPSSWHFIVGTLDAATKVMKMYLGTTLLGTATLTGTLRNFNSIYFGRQSTGVYANLQPDAFWVVGRALTIDEITYLYNAGTGLSLNGLDPNPGVDAGRGAWTWFNDPRGIVTGSGQLVVGAVNHVGEIYTYRSDDSGATWGSFQNALPDTGDDHENPAYLNRVSDGKVLNAFSRHGGANYYFSVSAAANSAASFTRTDISSSIGAGSYSYANIFQLEGMTNDPIMIFFRGGTTPTWTQQYTISTNDGATWSAATSLITPTGTGRPYLKAAKNGSTRIDFTVTDGHPNSFANNSVYHFYYDNGAWFTSAGVSLGSPPFALSSLTKVYDGTGERAWIWDIQIDGSGNPVIGYSRIASNTDHHYYYAKWDGATWNKNHVCAAGPSLYSGEPEYSGGFCIDPNDVDVLYCSRFVNNQWQMFRYTTADGGATWAQDQLTTGLGKSFRPFVLPGVNKLAYVYGKYTAYDNHYTAIRLIDI